VASIRRLLSIGCLVGALAAVSPAQNTTAGASPKDKIESLLTSGEPRLVAWGAHNTLAGQDKSLISDLVALADKWEPLSRQTANADLPDGLMQDQLEDRDAMAAVLDTLLQMHASVSADTLRNLAPDFGNDVAILLSRLPAEEAGPLALELYHSPPEHSRNLQDVSASLLALHPLPGFAADLMANIAVWARVVAVLPGTSVGFGGSIGSCALRATAARNGWPAIGQYALSKEKGTDAWQIVAGVDPIYARRELYAHYLVEDPCAMHPGMNLGAEQRLRLIAEMLNVAPDAIGWKTSPSIDIEFESSQQFVQSLRAFIAEQQEKQRATLAALAEHDLATPDEAEQSLPLLEIHLFDMRGPRNEPIGKLVNLPPRVEWFASP
jgi:hypothetical protein